ncbi:MAG: copper chaperone PCu(A)C [Gammaproteobacteria bacterium]|nr:copper chaperone PCu(A)C [Gammaproteobacteria bacterium]
MKKILCGVCLWLLTFSSWADIKIDNAYVPKMPPASMAYAAYLTLTNTGVEPRTLVSVISSDFDLAHLHRTVMKEGKSSMKGIHRLVIEAGETVSFEPGGMHVMLMKPKEPIAKQGKIPLVLTFDDGEKIEIMAAVKFIE